MKRAGICLAIGMAVVAGVVLDARPGMALDSAIVIKDDGFCGMPGADANGDMVTDGGVGNMTLRLENDDKVMIKCKGRDILNLSDIAQSFDGFECGLVIPSTSQLEITQDSHITIAPNGNATMTCTFRKPTTKQ